MLQNIWIVAVAVGMVLVIPAIVGWLINWITGSNLNGWAGFWVALAVVLVGIVWSMLKLTYSGK